MTAISVASGIASSVASGAGASGGGFAPALMYTVQPVGSTSGLPLTVQPIVRALNGMGAVDLTFSGNVTLILIGTGTLSGTTAVAAVAGIATFTDLVITGAGSCTFIAVATGYKSATSISVTTA